VTTMNLIDKMLEKKIWAVVGATPNTQKTANHIYHELKDAGYEVYAVNPNYDKMETGDPCYHSLQELPKIPDCVDFVVPPAITLKNLEEMDPAVIKNIWLQPGTYNEEVVRYAEDKGFETVHDLFCVMVELRHKK
jgi:predicted CoA-binding protein